MSNYIRDIIESKRQWHYQPNTDELALGFKGWRSRGYLPHFDAPGVQQFLTYRLADALPASLRHEWGALLALADEREKRLKLETYLDKGHGECHLRQPEIAAIVQENLLHFDGERYRVIAWCIMPNHVHAVIEVRQTPLAELLHSWKSYTSKAANKVLGRAGHFWQDEYFDRYIRDEAHLRKAIRYTENNPVKAGLTREPAAWPWSSAGWRDEYCRLRLDGKTDNATGNGKKDEPTERSAGGPPASPTS